MILNANSIVEHVIQNKNGIMINLNVSVKTLYMQKKITVAFLAPVFVKILDI